VVEGANELEVWHDTISMSHLCETLRIGVPPQVG
jgi:hypothetical protein